MAGTGNVISGVFALMTVVAACPASATILIAGAEAPPGAESCTAQPSPGCLLTLFQAIAKDEAYIKVQTLARLGVAQAGAGLTEEARATFAQAARNAREGTPDSSLALAGLAIVALAQAEAGDGGGAVRSLETARAMLASLPIPRRDALAQAAFAAVAYAAKDGSAPVEARMALTVLRADSRFTARANALKELLKAQARMAPQDLPATLDEAFATVKSSTDTSEVIGLLDWLASRTWPQPEIAMRALDQAIAVTSALPADSPRRGRILQGLAPRVAELKGRAAALRLLAEARPVARLEQVIIVGGRQPEPGEIAFHTLTAIAQEELALNDPETAKISLDRAMGLASRFQDPGLAESAGAQLAVLFRLAKGDVAAAREAAREAAGDKAWLAAPVIRYALAHDQTTLAAAMAREATSAGGVPRPRMLGLIAQFREAREYGPALELVLKLETVEDRLRELAELAARMKN